MKSESVNNEHNKKIEKNLASWFIYLCSTWITIGTPIAAGLFINDIYQRTDISSLRLSFYICCGIVHLLLSFFLFYSTTRKSVSSHFDKVVAENEEYENELLPNARKAANVFRRQTQVIYSMLLELEKTIDLITAWPVDYPEEKKKAEFNNAIESMLYPLTLNRAELFGYEGHDLYNFCFYIYNEESKKLEIYWRNHDDRMSTSNRNWAPGHGHVGLTYIQDELKICQDITKSSELSSSSSNNNDHKNYRSFLSIPVRDPQISAVSGNPLGVLVFTSNRAGQFSENRDAIFGTSIAKILSILVDELEKSEKVK
ncbi:GAF domain-containing protein [Pseudomonas abyssi]|nr:GAF domain-containing protein [Halopseudomonas gallaeciensis]